MNKKVLKEDCIKMWTILSTSKSIYLLSDIDTIKQFLIDEYEVKYFCAACAEASKYMKFSWVKFLSSICILCPVKWISKEQLQKDIGCKCLNSYSPYRKWSKALIHGTIKECQEAALEVLKTVKETWR